MFAVSGFGGISSLKYWEAFLDIFKHIIQCKNVKTGSKGWYPNIYLFLNLSRQTDKRVLLNSRAYTAVHRHFPVVYARKKLLENLLYTHSPIKYPFSYPFIYSLIYPYILSFIYSGIPNESVSRIRVSLGKYRRLRSYIQDVSNSIKWL